MRIYAKHWAVLWGCVHVFRVQRETSDDRCWIRCWYSSCGLRKCWLSRVPMRALPMLVHRAAGLPSRWALSVSVCGRQTDDCLERLTHGFAATSMWLLSHHAGSSEGQHSARGEERETVRERFLVLFQLSASTTTFKKEFNIICVGCH